MVDIAQPRVPQAPTGRFAAMRTRAGRLGELSRDTLRNPTTLIGLVILGVIFAMALFAPFLVPQNPAGALQMPRDWGAINQPPGTPGHPLGTTGNGGDVLYGIVWGSRTSLQLAVTVVSITVTVGVIMGSVAGFLGGKWDEIIMRLVDVFLSIPELIFALAIAAVLGPSFANIILALAVVFWVKYARIIRGQIMAVKQNEYVDAAYVVGDSKWNVYRKDVLPNSITPVVVQATLDMGHVVLIGATLSFIGLAEAGLAEWGNLVSEGQAGIAAGRWWVATFSGAMVFLWALAFNLVGDGLRDVLDPRTEGR